MESSPVHPASPPPPPRRVAISPPHDDTPMAVRFVPDGISKYYEFFFKDKALVGQVSSVLGPLMKADSADIRVRFTVADMKGRVDLLLPPGEPRALAMAEAWTRTGELDPGPLLPLLEGVAGYRDAVGGRYDLRVFSFPAGVEVALPGGGTCLFSEPPGGPPEPSIDSAIHCQEANGNRGQILPATSGTWPSPPQGSQAPALINALHLALAGKRLPAQGSPEGR